MILCDNAMQLDTADATGNTLTAAIMSVGFRGDSLIGWTANGTGANMTIGSSTTDRLGSARLRHGGDVYTPTATHRRFLLEHSAAQTYLSANPTATPNRGSVGTWWTPGPTDDGGSGKPYDILRFSGLLGGFAIVQHWNGAAPNGGGYAINLHSDPGGLAQTTGNIVVTRNTTYWVTLWVDWFTLGGIGACKLQIFDSTGASLGSLSSDVNTVSTGSSISNFQIGNAESGTSAGNTSSFEGTVVDFRTAVFPLGPVGGFEKSFQEISHRPAPFKPGIAK